MVQFYLSAYEYIKNKPFDVWVPAFYHPHLPEHMKDPRPAPIEKTNRWRMVSKNGRNTLPLRQLADPNQIQKASYSIEIMLDMFRKKVEFELCHEEDVVEIFENLDRYLNTLRPDVEQGNERAAEYAKLVISWRSEVYKHYFRYMKLNPAALEKLYPGNDTETNLFSLMSSVGGLGEEVEKLDPLRAKAHPPYRVEDVSPRSDGLPHAGETFIENSFGISSSSPLLEDNGKDFNFDDFLK